MAPRKTLTVEQMEARRDIGALKRDLINLWLSECNAFAKGVMQDIRSQEREPLRLTITPPRAQATITSAPGLFGGGKLRAKPRQPVGSDGAEIYAKVASGPRPHGSLAVDIYINHRYAEGAHRVWCAGRVCACVAQRANKPPWSLYDHPSGKVVKGTTKKETEYRK